MRLRRSSAAALAMVSAAALVAGPATAQEAGPSSAEVERRLATAEERLAELEADASLAVEAVNEARVAVDRSDAELAATTAAAAVARDRTDELRRVTDAVARSIFKTGGTNLQFGALLSADGPTEAGTRYATVRRVLDGHRGDIEELTVARTELSVLETQLAAQRDEAAERADELEERRAQLESTLRGQSAEIAVLERELSAAQDREAAARRAAEEAAAREAAERAAAERAAAERAAPERPAPAAPTSGSRSGGSGTAGGSSGGGSSAPSPAPSTRQSAQVAVDTAVAQVGKPYQWGGGGPNSFDCSGLTSYGWRAAGVSLPHSSRMQYAATSRVGRGQLQPGDLVFFGSPIHHVAMYIGGGRVVEASRAGVPVRISSTALGRSDVAGYGRP